MRRLLFFLLPFYIIASRCTAQVAFECPLPFGILQVHEDHADLRLHATLGGYSSFSYKLSSDIDTSSIAEGWSSLTVTNGSVDTLITVPASLRNYALYWRTGLSPSDTNGVIADLTPGHIIGIAGQSNAQGSIGNMTQPAVGDIRMLTGDSLSWQVAHEPTGGFAGGPWIVMSNMLYSRIGDTLPIGIVNTAIGATGLTIASLNGRWIRNPINPTDSSLYGLALKRFRHAGSELECLCWIQGEADAVKLSSIQDYRNQFDSLMEGFQSDLGVPFRVFHLQVGGNGKDNLDFWPQVREAERLLPPSTLVGTGLGQPLLFDELHYNDTGLRSIGETFAAAILKEKYQISSPRYPPLVPDSFVTLDSITDGSIPGKYCFSVRWTRAGQPVKLRSLTTKQYFGLIADEIPLDTSLVWYRIAPDSTRVFVGERTQPITMDYSWAVTYDYAASADSAPIATLDDSSGDTIYATAFYDLPVNNSAFVPISNDEWPLIVPNPTSNFFSVDVSSLRGRIDATLVSEDGAIQWTRSFPNDHSSTLFFDLSNHISGTYLLRLTNGHTTINRKCILAR